MPEQMTVDELARRLAAGEPTLLVDVRQPWEHATAALPGDILIPLHEIEDRWQEIEPAPGAVVVTYCHHGIRSLGAAGFLESQGMTAVRSLAGGIDAWSCTIDSQVPRY